MHDRLIDAKVHDLIAYEIDLKTIDALERNALHMTINANNVLIIEALLECHIDTSIQDKENDTTRFYLNCVNTTKYSNSMKSRAQIMQLLNK